MTAVVWHLTETKYQAFRDTVFTKELKQKKDIFSESTDSLCYASLDKVHWLQVFFVLN